jgi:hypothetical protein
MSHSSLEKSQVVERHFWKTDEPKKRKESEVDRIVVEMIDRNPST